MESESVPSHEKLPKFREVLKQNDLDGYFIPCNDAHNSEYLAKCDERICFISNFSGSNGAAFVSHNEAILWTDSRYYIQAEKELLPSWKMKKLERGEISWFQFVVNLYENQKEVKIGFDPMLIAADICETRIKFFEKNNIKFIPITKNLVDEIWIKKPSMPKNPVFIFDLEYCAEAASSKFKTLYGKLLEKNKELTSFNFLTSKLDEIAYVLNLRGSDIDYNPVFLSYLFIEFSEESSSGHLFINPDSFDSNVRQYLSNLNISLHNYSEIFDFLGNQKKTIYLDKNNCNFCLIHSISNKELVVNKVSPIEMMKAVKNSRELQGLRECHIRDGAAVVAYLAWLKHELLVAKRTDLTEYSAALKLEDLRKQQKLNKGLSFDTISAIGPNAAIVHYKPEEKTAAFLNPNEVYLVDSGGQYLDGTTDITRTVHYTQPKPEEKNAYTRVLLGNLDLEKVKWPAKSKIHGGDLDVLARRRLWEIGLDYGHGTGHGVGYFLNVHEGPHGISKHREEPLVEGMMVSDEPGYYESGKFGIRIENCILVVKSSIEGFLQFENITLAPYDRNLINLELLSKWDKEYIDQYHKRVYNSVLPVLKEMKVEDYIVEWLTEATMPL